MDAVLTPEVVRALLEELASRLAATGATAHIRVVGGAAIAMLDPTRRATSDIDAVVVGRGADVEPLVAQMAKEVAQMAKEHDLPADWFNSAALMWIPFVGVEDWVEIQRIGDVTVSLRSTAMLLA